MTQVLKTSGLNGAYTPNENPNSLVRQYFSRKTVLAQYDQPYFDGVAAGLNARPRQTLEGVRR